MRKIAVFTGSRAEYGLLYWLMKAIEDEDELELQVLVSSMHLAPQFGDTYKEIEADGFKIAAKIEMLVASDTSIGVAKSMGLGIIGFADTLARLNPDVLVLLGDRFETLAIAQVALVMKIPIVHIHGGELTLGAYDDAIRHAVSKMASLHFVATEEYRRRVIQLGEKPSTVINVGALGLEHIIRTPRLSFEELRQELQIPLQHPYLLVTYHPETLGEEAITDSLNALLNVLEESSHHLLFTAPNADNGGHLISHMLDDFCKRHPHRAFIVKSLGSKKYLSAAAHAEAVVGNSSSAIIEVPLLGVPTVNIGLRQKGRLAAESIIHTPASYSAMKNALDKALSADFKIKCRHVTNPYGDGQVSKRILPVLKTHVFCTRKPFQDLEFHYEHA